ncbi:GAF domain-containing protein [Chenggangzhangella methanolivorans]|uniref:GAF domain-containing protein n=1 Tax=Chenggangzhangella methanolivorans TaxID=1437009 RepID=UPI0021BDD5EC|nr:GAF domain-containing protein [Chenggangzhangella methanolivorans]
MDTLDLTACDREPIHAPGAIQPHGLLLVADPSSLKLLGVAGDVESKLGLSDWSGQPLQDVIGSDFALRAKSAPANRPAIYLGKFRTSDGEAFDASAHRAECGVIVELEPAEHGSRPGGVLLGEIEATAAALERAASIDELCAIAAKEFRRITGYDRIMIYRFLDDDSGQVLGEDRDPSMRAFMHHRFPATDIPKQARALYLRNLVRVIPDVGYAPAPLRFADGPLRRSTFRTRRCAASRPSMCSI